MANLTQAVEQCQGPVKLHLGCGPNLLEGWINIEGDYIGEKPGITVHNITEPYPIPDESVDEILSVHVIEHIMHSEVSPMMQEWHRILKPDGFVAVEWPDILKMCQYICRRPESLWTEDRKIQKMTLAGIFGNIGKYKDPAMLHKWGYSAESMCVLLEKNGFSKTEIQVNNYRKTKIDSRVVAWK